jgi:hypothetical protein
MRSPVRPAALLAACALALAIGAAPAVAADCTGGTTAWTNAAGGDWGNDANWSNGRPTAACDAVITLDGTYVVRVGFASISGAVARSITVGGATGTATLFDDNGGTCTAADCNFDYRILVGDGGIVVNQHGALALRVGRIETTGAVVLWGGRMSGTGALRAAGDVVSLGGTVAPETVPGEAAPQIRILGNYQQDAGATLVVDGPTQTATGVLSVTGLVELAGNLRVFSTTPEATVPLAVVTGESGRRGRFSGVTFSGRAYDVVYRSGSVALVVRPVLSRFSVRRTTFTSSAVLRFTSSDAAEVAIDIAGLGRGTRDENLSTPAQVGVNRYRLDLRRFGGLPAGRYRITLRAVDAAGRESRPVARVVRVLKRRS